jgi:hypothetical protein
MFEDDEPVSRYKNDRLVIPIWGFLVIFFGPAGITVSYLYYYSPMDYTASAIIALAVMNGSINTVIAWLTIRLDGHSNDALEHLDTIMGAMEELDETMLEANQMVDSFTTDLDSAKELFDKVGVDLSSLDLEPVAEVVEKLKENKDGFSEILDNLKGVDVTQYINQAKRIDWQSLLDSAEEIMGFIQTTNQTPMRVPQPSIRSVTLPKIETLFEKDDFFDENLTLKPPVSRGLTLTPPKRSN